MWEGQPLGGRLDQVSTRVVRVARPARTLLTAPFSAALVGDPAALSPDACIVATHPAWLTAVEDHPRDDAGYDHHRLLAGFQRILTTVSDVLRPGANVAIIVRPWREHAELMDLPSQNLACGTRAGLVPVERCVALLGRVADDGLVARGSFFQRDFIRKQREAGLPLHLIAHEDVLVFRVLGVVDSLLATPGPHRPHRRRPERRPRRGAGRTRHATLRKSAPSRQRSRRLKRRSTATSPLSRTARCPRPPARPASKP